MIKDNADLLPSVVIHEQAFLPYQILASTEEALRQTNGGQIGAAASFVGTMRDHNQGDTIQSMFLEHYPGMTEKVLERLCEHARREYRCYHAIIHHRVGEIQVDEPIVLVAVWSAHRAEAFAACQAMMEALKADAPFWKREQLVSQTGDPEQDQELVTRWVAGNTSGKFIADSDK